MAPAAPDRQNPSMASDDFTEPFLIKLKAVIDADPELTPAGLATKAGLNNALIRAWFANRNRSPRIDSARKVCAALGTTLEEFMSEAQTEEEKEIVRLVSQLPVHLRRQLIGYGQGLLANADQGSEGSDEGAQ